MYEEFTPYSLSQFKERDVKSFNTFNAAVDDYFSKIEGQRQEERRAKAENEALNRLNRVREDVNKRAENLFEEVCLSNVTSPLCPSLPCHGVHLTVT